MPKHWPRLFGLDPGLNTTAAVWGALDNDTDVLYLYSEHYIKEALPAVHAQAIRARGHWIPGMIDPSSHNRSALSFEAPLEVYRKMGLRLREANNKVGGDTGGIYEVYERLATGRLKVYRTLSNWLREFRQYSRDKKGRIVKHDDHLMDATRYLVMGLQNAALPHPDNVMRIPRMQEETFGIYT